MEMDQYLAAYEEARRVWPRLDVPLEPFARQLKSIAYSPGHADHVGALYLCVGCALGIPDAIDALERTEFPLLRVALARIARQEHVVDELLQEVRDRLLVGTPARIATYRGSGPLASWLRVVATRAALDYRRARALQRRRTLALARHLEATSERSLAAERVVDEGRSREVERLLREALGSLEPMERQLVRHYFGARLSIDVLGVMYGVDRSTVARRVQRAVERIRQQVRASVAARFSAPRRRDVDELLAGLRERIDVDLSALLAPHGVDTAAGAGPLAAGTESAEC